MMQTPRHVRPIVAIAALLLFGAWIGSGWLHEHPADPSCQICKELQASQAVVARLAEVPELSASPEPVPASAVNAAGKRLVSIPQGRAPPTA